MEFLFKMTLSLSFLFSLLFFLLAFLNPNATIDIQQHDTYFVLPLALFYTMLGGILLVKTGVSFWIKKQKKNSLSRFLVIVLLLELSILAFLLWIKPSHHGVPRRYYQFDGFQSFGEFPSPYFVQLLVGLLIVYLINQVFFVLITSLVVFGSKDTT